MRKLASRGAGILMAGLILTSSACAHGQGAGTEPVRPNEAGGAVQLYVTNNSGGPMEVYAAGTGTLYRIGTVHPGLEGRFVVRPTMVVNGTVEFVARSGNGPDPPLGADPARARRRGGLRPHAESGNQPGHGPATAAGDPSRWEPGLTPTGRAPILGASQML